MAKVQLVRRPRRWDEPFAAAAIHPDIVGQILSSPAFEGVDAAAFPDDLPLHGLVANDCRITRHGAGDIIYQSGSHQTSIFIVLNGAVHIPVQSDPKPVRPEKPARRAPWLRALLLGTHWRRGEDSAVPANGDTLAVPVPAAVVGPYEIFGELEAMARAPRAATVRAAADRTVLLEIRWPGVRELLNWSDAFRQRVDGTYYRHSIEAGLRENALFAHIDPETLKPLAQHCQFERYGSFDWTHLYQRQRGNAANDPHAAPAEPYGHEPVIVEQGHHLDDVFLIRSGFARLTVRSYDPEGDGGHDSETTIGFLKKGDSFGRDEIAASLRHGTPRCARQALRAIGYADIVRVPAEIIESHVLGRDVQAPAANGHAPAATPPRGAQLGRSLLDFSIDNRFINATQAMVIDTTRCVNCDDCVRACAATHGGVARFARTGLSHDTLMVANACMHCTDPVCLIDCPTGAIHRNVETGAVVIDESTCIGCANCASACPYDNIRMREARNADGAFLIDEDGGTLLKATKCDLCAGRSGGPACQRACPHDALMRIDIGAARKPSDWLEHP